MFCRGPVVGRSILSKNEIGGCSKEGKYYLRLKQKKWSIYVVKGRGLGLYVGKSMVLDADYLISPFFFRGQGSAALRTKALRPAFGEELRRSLG